MAAKDESGTSSDSDDDDGARPKWDGTGLGGAGVPALDHAAADFANSSDGDLSSRGSRGAAVAWAAEAYPLALDESQDTFLDQLLLSLDAEGDGEDGAQRTESSLIRIRMRGRGCATRQRAPAAGGRAPAAAIECPAAAVCRLCGCSRRARFPACPRSAGAPMSGMRLFPSRALSCRG